MKNWIVISKPIKNKRIGLAKYSRYLVSKTHPNHLTTEIVSVHNSASKFVNTCLKEVRKRNDLRIEAKKGGRPISSYAQSFVLSLPEDVRLEVSEWKKVARCIFKDLALFLEIEPVKFKDYCFLNLHIQKNQHLNILISKVIDGNVVRNIQRKAINNILKQSFNVAMKHQIGFDNQTYEPRTKRNKRYNSSIYEKHKDIINASGVCERSNEERKIISSQKEYKPINKQQKRKINL